MATPQGHPRRADAADPTPSGSTRARLLAAAYDLLVEEGYHATTVQSVARRAGLTTGAIYANFTNKQELMAIAVLNRWSQLEQQVLTGGRVMAPEPEGDAGHDRAGKPGRDDWTTQVARHLAAPPAPEHQLLTEVTGAVLRDDGQGSPLFAGVQTLDSVIRTSVEEGKARGTIDDRLSTDAVTAIFVNLYLGAITSKSWGLPQPEADDIAAVLAALQRGLHPD